jgi:dTDP-D-glucose 4,6-dehydratase
MFIDDLCSAVNFLFQDWEKNKNCVLQSNWNFSPLEMAKEIGILLNDLSWFSSSNEEIDQNSEWLPSNLQKIIWPAQEKFQICLKKTVDWYRKNQWFMSSFGEPYK